MLCLKQDEDAGFNAIMKLFEALQKGDSTTIAYMMLTHEMKFAIDWGRANIPEKWGQLEKILTGKVESDAETVDEKSQNTPV